MKKVRLTQRITSRETESFRRYLEEIREINQMTVDEEYEMALKAQKGDEKAILHLIEANLRFVVSVAKQFVSQENSLEDLVEEGNHGLIYAARRYDPSMGFKFITYAVWWIRRDILTYINRNARLIRLPNNKLTLLSKLKEEVANIEQLLERTPTFNDIMQFTEGYDKDDVKFFIESERENSYSFDKPVQDEDSQTLMSDLFEDDTFGPTDQHVLDDDSNYRVNLLLSKLKNDRSRIVMIRLFGLDGKPNASISDVADELDVSRERVRQIREKSLKVLRELVN